MESNNQNLENHLNLNRQQIVENVRKEQEGVKENLNRIVLSEEIKNEEKEDEEEIKTKEKENIIKDEEEIKTKEAKEEYFKIISNLAHSKEENERTFNSMSNVQKRKCFLVIRNFFLFRFQKYKQKNNKDIKYLEYENLIKVIKKYDVEELFKSFYLIKAFEEEIKEEMEKELEKVEDKKDEEIKTKENLNKITISSETNNEEENGKMVDFLSTISNIKEKYLRLDETAYFIDSILKEENFNRNILNVSGAVEDYENLNYKIYLMNYMYNEKKKGNLKFSNLNFSEEELIKANSIFSKILEDLGFFFEFDSNFINDSLFEDSKMEKLIGDPRKFLFNRLKAEKILKFCNSIEDELEKLLNNLEKNVEDLKNMTKNCDLTSEKYLNFNDVNFGRFKIAYEKGKEKFNGYLKNRPEFFEEIKSY